MRLTVTGHRMTVTDAARADLAARLARLDRRLGDGAASAQCVVSQERQMVTCELTVHVGGGQALHGLGRSPRLATAAGLAVEKVLQQASRRADRQRARRRGTRQPRTDGRAVAAAPATAAGPRVIRSHGYDIKPLSLDDAVLALDGSHRAFLVFRLASTERTAILFRRPDGHFGLIEPEA